MTANSLDRIGRSSASPSPERVGQATAVEQSRAVAEVQAAIVVAQQVPRDTQSALTQMRDSCQQMALAERAFFRYSRGGGTITGPSVHLARELARCWGNLQYGIAEMRRDDLEHQSEMQAYAWDVQTNARSAVTFIVPHKRDTREGPKALTDMRDVYENNANAGARRVREAIFSILPPWFIEEAKDICQRTLAEGGGRPLAQRVSDAIARFADLGITQTQLEQRVDRAVSSWNEHDVAQLGVVYKSLQRGEVSRDEEFPSQRVTGDEISGSGQAQPSAGSPEQMSGEQRRKLFALLGDLGISERDAQLDTIEQFIGRRPEHRDALGRDEASQVIDALEAQLHENFSDSTPEGGESK